MAITVTGAAGATESFELAPPTKENVFNMMGDFIRALEDPTVQGVDFSEAQNDFIVGLDNAMEKIGLTLGSIGARGNALDSVKSAAQSMDIVNKSSRASLSEVDFAEAVSDLQKAELALNTSYAAYSRVSQLSLFNYI
ncbi:flagellin [Agarivorans gilvus]|uniref:flagellin n=1 Tax=Agarivorans gilvus TaxID=680279 RepID=UPI0006EC33BE|nr:flagellin [Agarivorans gilvus]